MKSKALVLIVLLLLVSMGTVFAWQVANNGLGRFSLHVEHAEATLTLGTFDIGSVGSGYDFSETVNGTIAITYAETLYVEFGIDGLDEVEKAAFVSLSVSIGEDLDDDDVLDDEEVWQTIDCLAPIGLLISHPLDEGVHDILMRAEGTAGYPESDVPVDFTVTAVTTTPLVIEPIP